MANHFWWNATSSGSGFDAIGTSAASTSVSRSCSTVDVSAGSGGALSWMGAEGTEKLRSGDNQPAGSASGSTVTYQEAHQEPPTYGLSASTMDWNQALFRSSGRAEPSFNALLQDDMISRPFFHQDPPIDSGQMLMLDQHHLSSNNELGDRGLNNFHLAPAKSYGCSTAILRGQFESDIKPQQSTYHDNRSVLNNFQSPTMNYREQIQPSWPNFPQLAPSSEQQSTNQFQFFNNTQLYSQFAPYSIEQKPSGTNLTQKSNISESSSSVAKKRSNSGGGSEPVFRKPRIETPSPLPSFKVRKEKLGDRITALQQLVSPFGKTDTASVLHEAIEYIKFLHDQVNALSNPYLKNGHPQHQKSAVKSKDIDEQDADLRSRGLCLVPVASTYSVATQTPSDFWTPTFGGTFR